LKPPIKNDFVVVSAEDSLFRGRQNLTRYCGVKSEWDYLRLRMDLKLEKPYLPNFSEGVELRVGIVPQVLK